MLKHEDVFVLSIHAVLLLCLQNRAKIIQFFSQRRGGEQRRWLMLVNEVEREDPAVAGNNLLDLVLQIRILARPRRLHVRSLEHLLQLPQLRINVATFMRRRKANDQRAKHPGNLLRTAMSQHTRPIKIRKRLQLTPDAP